MKTGRASPKQSKTFPWLVILVAAAIIAAAAWALLGRGKESAAYPPEVNVSQAYELYQKGAFMLDVREQSEWETVHIPGATLVPLGALPTSLESVPRNAEVVVVCRSGNRSATGRDILLDAGFTTVTSMAGGMNQWQTAGYPIASGP